MELQKAKARASWSAEEVAVAPVYRELFQQYPKTDFVGYDTSQSDATVLAILKNGKIVHELSSGRHRLRSSSTKHRFMLNQEDRRETVENSAPVT